MLLTLRAMLLRFPEKWLSLWSLKILCSFDAANMTWIVRAGPGGPGHRGPGHCGSVRAVRAGPLRSFHLYRAFVESTKPHLKSTAPAWRKETT